MRINWKLALQYIAIGYFHCIGLAKAQPFTFADTHPVNNPDSLEQWLTANPKAPVLVRIKNLIILERTRYWLGANKIGRYIPTLHTLAVQTRNPTALAAYEFLSAKKAALHDDFYRATLHGSRALNQFEKLNDASGQINTHGLLSSIIYDQFGHPTAADSNLTEAHWKQCQTILAAYPNPHDQMYIDKINIRRTRNQADINHMEQLILGTLQHIKTHPVCSYARGAFEHILSGLYFERGNFWAAYRQLKKVLTTYPTTDPHELASLYYNLGNTCLKLNRLNEGFRCYENAIKFSLAATPVRYTILIGANNNACALAENNGLFKKAFLYLAQARAYEMKANSQENSRRMQDLQARYESARHQRQIDLLEQKQKIAQFESKVYIVALWLAVSVLAAISLLAWRLYHNRQQLQQSNQQLTSALAEVQQLNTTLEHFIQIIAHDMRKPLISFQGLAEHISLLLRQQAYDDIKVVSNAIDSTGIQIETMLDNLLKWALTQREPIPYQPRAVQLATTIETVVGLYRTLSHHQTVSILVHCPESLNVWADPNALELIIRNLVDNALKQLRTNGQITITCQPGDDADVQIQIADTGRGMAVRKLAFLQGVLSGQEPGHVGQNGLGLGLLLVRDFIQRNKGHITVDSIQGQGTTFRLNLPVDVNISSTLALVN